MEKSDDPVERLVNNRPDLREQLEQLLEVDRTHDWWEFDDVPLDSGEFGEIASWEILDKDGSQYRLTSPEAAERALATQNTAADTGESQSQVDRMQFISDRITRIPTAVVRRWGGVAILAVMFVAAAVRLVELGSAPFFGDEIWQVWASRTYLLGEGFSNPIGPSNPYRRAWLTTSLPIAGSFWLLGLTEFAGRLPFVIIGVGTIGIWYLFAREVFNRQVGMVFAVVLAFEPYMITWARMARNYAPLQLLFAAGSLVFFLWFRDDKLQLRSPFVFGFALISLLGYITHRNYLALGAVIPAFLVISILVDWTKTRLYDDDLDWNFVYRRLGVVFLCAVAGVGFLATRGIPSQLVAAPEWFGGRPWDFYLTLFQTEYPFLYVMSFIGFAYTLIRSSGGRYLAFVFLIPFFAHTYSPWREPRYIAHIYPVFILFTVVAVLIGTTTLVRAINEWEDPTLTIGNYHVSQTTAAVGCVALLLFTTVVSPWSALAFVTDTQHGYIEDRSDHRTPTSDLREYIDDEDAVLSSTPHMTMWYLSREETEYMLSAQRPDYRFEQHSGQTVDTRTGTIVLNENISKLQATIEQYEQGWFYADTRYRNYVSNEMKRTVETEMVRLSSDRWANIDMYYWGPKETLTELSQDPNVTVHS